MSCLTQQLRAVASHKLLMFALLSSIVWYMFWVVMAPVEKDIAHIFNWYDIFLVPTLFQRIYTHTHTYAGTSL